MAEAHRASLEAALTESAAEASALRELARSQPPTEADMAQALSSMRLVDLFLSDLNEALRQLFVAGLSFPDPELPEGLRELHERARTLRLPTALERLSKLRAWLLATLAEPDLDARAPLARGAWDETQRLLAWSRLYKAEHDLRTVQARLTAEAQGVKVEVTPTFKTCSLSVWPVGVELAPSGKFIIHGVATDDGRAVVLADHLAEYDPQDPFAGRAISRLFQEAIELPRLLRSVIRLEEHPFTEKEGVLFFRPAFRSIPKMLPAGDGFRAPKLPSLNVGIGAQIPSGPFLLSAAVSWSGGRLHLGSLQGEIPIRVPPLLRFNLAKLLVREGLRRDEIDVCLQAKEDEFELLHATTALDGRAYPAVDSSVYRVAREVLQARAERVSIVGEPVAELFLMTSTHAMGHGKPEKVEALRKKIMAASPQSVEERYRLGLAKALLGLSLDPAKERPLLVDALALLLRPANTPVDLSRLSRVLGFALAHTSASDVRYLDGAFAYRVVWLVMQANLVDELRSQLQHLYEASYKGELKDPSIGDVCARALLLALLAQKSVGATALRGELAEHVHVHEDPDDEDDEDDEDEDEDEDDDSAEAVQLDRGNEGWTKARDFLQAHLDDLAPRKATTRGRPMPELIELLQLGDTRAFLHGEGRLGRTIDPLKLPAERVRHACIEALLAWCSSVNSERPTWQEAAAAADALLVLVASGQEPFVLS